MADPGRRAHYHGNTSSPRPPPIPAHHSAQLARAAALQDEPISGRLPRSIVVPMYPI